jgi:hypothetical protein
MNNARIIYWGLMIALAVTFTAAIWAAFFADPLLEKRGKLAEVRLGKRVVKIFKSMIRALAMTAAILSLYLIVNLIQIYQCAIR